MLRNSRLRWLLALLAVLSLAAAACSDDSGDDGGGSAAGGGDGGAAALPDCLDFAAIYSIVGPESTATTWGEAGDLASQLGSAQAQELTDLGDLPLSIFGPGEESGTFDSFAELVLEGTAEAQGVPEDNWLPRPDYTSSPNDNVIIQGIEDTEGSFGWVGFAYYEEAAGEVRPFQVAGDDGTCVEPTTDTIASGEYPISRPLFFYVNTDKAADNPAVQAFVDYYLGDDGFQAVADAGYVQIPEEDWTATQDAWTEAGGSPGEPASDVSGDVVISGSSTVEPISSLVGEQFSGANPGTSVSVDGPGTGDGFELFCSGETDISDASRPIEDDEAQACADAGINYVELYIGIDGITVLTQA